jgi:cytochrome P450
MTTETEPTREELDAVLASIFLTADGKADPYPSYARIREATPLHRSSFGFAVATRYNDCQQILRDNRCGRGENTIDASAFGLTDEEFDARFPRRGELNESMLGLDPPDHTRLRGLVSKAFTPRTVESLKPRIEQLTNDLLEPLEGGVDVIPAIALKLPITVIGEMLGVPREDHAALLPHVKVVIRSLLTLEANLAEFAEIYAASNVIGDYFRDLAVTKRVAPTDDLLTELVHAEDAGDRLTDSELIATVILLFVAGYETTTNLIGNGLRALLLHPDQLQKVRDNQTSSLTFASSVPRPPKETSVAAIATLPVRPGPFWATSTRCRMAVMHCLGCGFARARRGLDLSTPSGFAELLRRHRLPSGRWRSVRRS